jgi:hypothetical protein
MYSILSVRRLQQLIADSLLAFITLVGVTVPFMRELFSVNVSESAILPVAVSHAAVVEKCILAMGVLLIVFLVALRGHKGTICRHLAALPLLRIACLTGATIAIGLASFDACTAYHGAELDNGGSCFCWLTGTLAGAGAFLAGIICVTGRTLATLMRDVVHGLVALFIVFDRLCKIASERLSHALYPSIASGSRLARRIAGRAPPVFA